MLSVKLNEKHIAIGLILAAVILRLVPHPWNFSPLLALALFSGAHLRTKTGAGILLGILFLSDLLLGFHALMPLTWGCFILVLFLGRRLRGAGFSPKVFAYTLAGSVLFYLITNFGVFLFTSLYPKSWAGLAECYRMALPFFRNALAGDLVYAFTIFGVYHAAVPRLARA